MNFNLQNDFTYFLKDNDLNVSAIRLTNVKDENNKLVITIYYRYFTFILTKNPFFLMNRTDFIFEHDNDHKKEYHKIFDPYDWHIHIKIRNDELSKYLNFIYKHMLFNIDDINNLNNIIISSKDIKFSNQKNLQLEGSNSDRDLFIFKQKLKINNYFYKTFIYDRLDYSRPHYNISVYIIRILNLRFKFVNKYFKKYKKIYKNILTQYRDQYDRINKNIKIVYKNSIYFTSNDKKLFNKTTDKIFINLVLCLLEVNNIKLTKKKIVIEPYDNEWKLNLINQLLNKNKTVTFEMKIYLAIISFIINQKIYNFKVDFYNYLISRFGIELAWSILQYYKYVYINKDKAMSKLHLKFIKNISSINRENNLSLIDMLDIFDEKFNFKNTIEYSGKPEEFERIKFSDRFSPFN